jgi:hypothetical protein
MKIIFSMKAVTVLLFTALLGTLIFVLYMPGSSFQGPLLEPASESVARLRETVETLAVQIGPRNAQYPKALDAAVNFLEQNFLELGCKPQRLPFGKQNEFVNLECLTLGRDPTLPQVIIGAHYDGANDSPSANDNGSGVAALLELIKMFHLKQPLRSIRWIVFANEEPPYFQTELMGSLVYAKDLKKAEVPMHAMLSLETMGFYSEQLGSQKYPGPLSLLYPSTGNFLAFVGDLSSGSLVRRAIASFRESKVLQSEGAVLPASLPGVSWSDHWSFSQVGVPSIMVTDTAPFRYPYYHTQEDLPDKIDYQRLALAVQGLAKVVEMLANE